MYCVNYYFFFLSYLCVWLMENKINRNRNSIPCEQLISPTPNEKLLRATVCFSIEHAQVHHTPRDTFDVDFIHQFIFHLKCLHKRMQISRQKR